jgi:hypothetical protein
VAVELQGQLHARERGLDSWDGAIVAWEDGLAAFEHAQGKVRIESDASCIQVEAVQQDFFAQTCASSSRSKRLISLNGTLEECHILLCLQEMDLEVQEVILAKEQARGLHPTDGQDLSAKQEESRVCVCVDGIKGERAIEAEQLS